MGSITLRKIEQVEKELNVSRKEAIEIVRQREIEKENGIQKR